MTNQIDFSLLAKDLLDDNALLFLDNDIIVESSTIPLPNQIAQFLAAKLNQSASDIALAQIAQEYEINFERVALERAVREAVESQLAPVSSFYKLFAQMLPQRATVLTTHFDRRLESELQQANKPYRKFVDDHDVPLADSNHVSLIKMHGDIYQSSTLRITLDDLEFVSDFPQKLYEKISTLLNSKDVLYLGNDPASPAFRHFFLKTRKQFVQLSRSVVAIVQRAPSESEKSYWQKHGVQLFAYDMLEFMQSLQAALTNQQPPLPPPLPPPPRLPYKGIVSFERTDSLIFAGRSTESRQLANRILNNPIVLLSGESGTGKSSLVNAGVAQLLLAIEGVSLVVATPSKSHRLVEGLGTAFLRCEETKAGLRHNKPEDSLYKNLQAYVRNRPKPIVLCVDQFEQIFVVLEEEERTRQLQELADIQQDSLLKPYLRLLITVREDYVGRLQKLESLLPGLMNARFYLDRLSRDGAYQAIVEPAATVGHDNDFWEPRLVETLLDELFIDKTGVVTPQLQIICQQLYEHALADQTTASEKYRINRRLFERYEKVDGILRDYFDSMMRLIPDNQRARVEVLLSSLVTTSGVKQRNRLDMLERVVAIERPALEEILQTLSTHRLLQRFETNRANETIVEYELSHDSLIPMIQKWLGNRFWQVQKVREIVSHALPDWQNEMMYLLAIDELRLIESQLATMRFAEDEQTLIFASSIPLVAPDDKWGTQLTTEQKVIVLRRLSQHQETQVRAKAVTALGKFIEFPETASDVAKLLDDENASVRESAAMALAGYAQEGVAHVQPIVQKLVMAAQNNDQNAQNSLAILRDRAPRVRSLLPSLLRRRVDYAVFALRWQRNLSAMQAALLRAFWGGFVALCFSFGLMSLSSGASNTTGRLRFFAIGLLFYGVIGGLSTVSGVLVEWIFAHQFDYKNRWLSSTVGAFFGGLALALLFWMDEEQWLGLVLGTIWLAIAFYSRGLADGKRTLIHLVLGLFVVWGVFLLTPPKQWRNAFQQYHIFWVFLTALMAGVGFTFAVPPQSENRDKW